MDQDDVQSSVIQALIDAFEGCIRDQDVGPLFGQLVVLARERRHDPMTRSRYDEALSAAVAPDPHQNDGATAVWTYGLAPRPPWRRGTPEVAASQQRQNRRRHHGSRLFR